MACRSDVVGALNIVLEDAPYGPNVEEAKVRSAHVLVCAVTDTADRPSRFKRS
jgi:actin related protein 2/3 complex subunit 5